MQQPKIKMIKPEAIIPARMPQPGSVAFDMFERFTIQFVAQELHPAEVG